MYIEQLVNKHKHLALYLPPILGIIFVMVSNIVLSQGVDSAVMIGQMINQMGKTLTFAFLVGPFAIFLIFLLIWIKFVQSQSLTSLTTSRAKVDWKRVFFSFILWAFFSATFIIIDFDMNNQDYVWNFNAEKFFPFLIIALVLLPMQTSFEEYLFRGHLMQGLGLATKTRWIPLVVSSVLFGLMHIANPEVGKLGMIVMVYYIGTGFFLGIITLMDEGLELALGFHAANNIVAALLVTSDWTVLQTHAILKSTAEPSAGLEIILPIFVVFPVLLFAFSKIYKWKNWQEKLLGWQEHQKEINS
jgi:membrane protease YdiL (CAAX protease family)